ncbi:hypothetical protein [Demequina flava]|uniref:hypothetical protein n=1 Tax=Demequina flava TaxID=1095025 RepID=UPI000ABB4CC4|nr:hypothetical protein [Demequina flava]
MKTARLSPHSGSFRWARQLRVSAIAAVAVALVAACSTSEGTDPTSAEAEPSGASGSATVAESPSPVQDLDDADNEDTAESVSYVSEDVGTASLHVDGVEFSDFLGDCEISRNNGAEDVGDLNEGDIVTVIAIDNVAAHEDIAMNYVAINKEEFTFRDLMGAAGVDDPTADGVITTLTELGPRTADGSRDIVEVRFAGILEDGTTVDADIVCELQNAF